MDNSRGAAYVRLTTPTNPLSAQLSLFGTINIGQTRKIQQTRLYKVALN